MDTKMDIETYLIYTEVAVHMLKKTANEITPKEVVQEVKMLIKKFELDEVKAIKNCISKRRK